ncbi:NUDIX domain protein [uncultured archaeon]|nr:NUDIX domain protein [uncultured archaeon]
MNIIPQESSRGAVIFRMEGRERLYLLLHYEAGHWEFVKGKREAGEEEKDTVVREAREETGIVDLRFIDGFRERIEYFYRREGQTIHKEVVFFLAETKTRNITLSDEHIGFDWLDYDGAMKRLTFENAKNVLGKAEEFLKN